MSSWPLNGKKGGNRKHSKIDTLPPEMKATVEEMIMDGSATYSDIVAYLEQQGCPDTAKEFSEYEYEVGRDGTVLPGYVDADNHHIDAVRYAVNRIWMRRGA